MPAKHNPGDIAARKKWNKAHMGTMAVGMRKEAVDEFKALCAANGETPNAVLKRAVEQYIELNRGI